MPLVHSYEITRVLPCIADRSKIRFMASLDADVSEVLPYLNATVPRSSYNPGANTLTVKKELTTFAIHSGGITGARLRDVEHAHEQMRWFLGEINDAWANRDAITPSYERGLRLTALQLYRHLPATNCKQCEETACMAFAVKLLDGEVSILRCAPLFQPEHKKQRSGLLELLDQAGLEVPPAFLV